MNFKIVGRIAAAETIAVGGAIREIERLRRHYGAARWRKIYQVVPDRDAAAHHQLRVVGPASFVAPIALPLALRCLGR
jgi:hypothetical protein